MKKNKKIPKFNDEEIYSRWIDEIYQKGQMGDYIDFKKTGKKRKYSLDFTKNVSENILIGIRLNRRVIDFAKKFSALRGMTYQSVLKDWIANGYLASIANLQKIKQGG